MDETTIRGLSGEAVTRLAYEYGLSPLGSDGTPLPVDLGASGFWLLPGKTPWAPHTTMAQADAVLRRLRAQGWWTEVQGGHADGFARVSRDGTEIEAVWPMTIKGAACKAAQAEAHALLLVSVLATWYTSYRLG
jgi:hypothetical protein